MRGNKRFTVFLLVSVGLLTAYLWMDKLSTTWIEVGLDIYQRVLEQSVGVPYQHRLLLPWLFTSWQPGVSCFGMVSILFHFVAFPMWYLGLWLWLWRFGKGALAITLLSTGYIVSGFSSWSTIASWSMLEMVLLVWLLVLIDREVTSLGIIVLATLNRPFTAGVLVLVYVLYHGRTGLPALLVWGALYGMLLIMFPFRTWVMGDDVIQRVWFRNSGLFLRDGIVNNVLWIPVWLLAIAGLRRADSRLRRLALVIPPYLLACALAATWYETRLLLTVYPIAGALVVKGMEK